MLLTATMVATHASFRAYADAAEQASAQASTRMVVNRLLMLVRTSTAHGPLTAGDAAAAGATSPSTTFTGDLVGSNFFELADPQDNLLLFEYRADAQEIWLRTTPAGGGAAAWQPLLGGVTHAAFTLQRRRNDDGLWVLERGTIELAIQPGADATLDLERGHPQTIHVVASTKPRKVE